MSAATGKCGAGTAGVLAHGVLGAGVVFSLFSTCLYLSLASTAPCDGGSFLA